MARYNPPDDLSANLRRIFRFLEVDGWHHRGSRGRARGVRVCRPLVLVGDITLVIRFQLDVTNVSFCRPAQCGIFPVSDAHRQHTRNQSLTFFPTSHQHPCCFVICVPFPIAQYVATQARVCVHLADHNQASSFHNNQAPSHIAALAKCQGCGRLSSKYFLDTLTLDAAQRYALYECALG